MKNISGNLPSSNSITAFQLSILSWGNQNLRSFPWRSGNFSNYQLVIAEILLQRTKVETVIRYMPEFFKKYASWRSLSKASITELQKILEPIGLSKRRAYVLERLSHQIVSHNGRIPCKREEIDKLTGVGQYIGNAIELLCCGNVKPLLDVNMARVLERYFGPRKLVDIRYDPYLQDLAHKVVEVDDPVTINWVILDFAALVCRSRKPECVDCPLSGCCKYYIETDKISIDK